VSARTPEPDPAQIREYLLRRMPDSVRARFEEAYFRDDALLDRIEAEEDVLVTEYVLGRLSETDRRRFEQSLLGMPYYQDRVRTTSQLNLRVARLKFRPHRPRESRRSAPEPDRLFPGRSGSAVAFAVLALLLVAAVVTAVRLRSELERKAVAPSSAAEPAPPVAAIVLDADAEPGPRLRRLARDERAPLLVVVPRRLVPPATREWRLLVLGADGALVWEGPVQKLADSAPGADLAATLPAGVPPAGLSSLLLKAGGVLEDALVPLGILEIEPAR